MLSIFSQATHLFSLLLQTTLFQPDRNISKFTFIPVKFNKRKWQINCLNMIKSILFLLLIMILSHGLGCNKQIIANIIQKKRLMLPKEGSQVKNIEIIGAFLFLILVMLRFFVTRSARSELWSQF